jgi:3-methyl-2-oxobutanoate hydroxymethyltransferase
MASEVRRKTTIKKLMQKKAEGERITSLGVYDAPMAQIADRVGFDLLMNGNAGPMSLLGHPDPVRVRFEEQLILTQAVARVTRYAMVVSHLPFMTYHKSKFDAITNAARMVAEGGADAVKCEGNAHTAEYIGEIVSAGIPVVGHIGMQASRRTEQSGYGKKGRSAQEAARIIEGARRFVEAGVFAFVVEQVPAEVATLLARTLPVPVLGVVAGNDLDGVYEISGDLVGYGAFPRPTHKRVFADVTPEIENALNQYREESLKGIYPPEEHTLRMGPTEYQKLLDLVG